MSRRSGYVGQVSEQGRKALDSMKYEVAQELGVDLQKGYNGHLTSQQCGRVGGNMVKRMIAYAEQHMDK